MIQNYDTNGLVFALNPEAEDIKKTEDDETYLAALDNIITAQQFFCIPLVSDELPRENKNNLFDRAIYKKDAKGRVTHIARKGVFDSENDIVIIPISKIVHLKNEDSLIEAVEKLFTKSTDGEYNLVITVGGQPDMPDALFSPFELKRSRKKREIERRLAMGGMKIESINKFFEMVGDVISNNAKREDIDEIMSEFSIDNDDKILASLRTTSQVKRDHYKGGVRASEIMTHTACGILSSVNYISPIEKLSAKMLAIANDFDDLILYDNKSDILTPIPRIVRVEVIDTTPRKVNVIPFSTFIMKTNSMASEIVKLIKKSGGKALIVEPNPELIFGEDRMIWPAIITQEDVCSYEVIGFIGALMITLERFLGNFLVRNNITRINIDGRKNVHVLKQATLGQLGRYISKRGGLVDQLISVKSDAKRKEFKQKIDDVADFRNLIMHNLLKTFVGNPITSNDISFNKLISNIEMYLNFHDSTQKIVSQNRAKRINTMQGKTVDSKNTKSKINSEKILKSKAEKNSGNQTSTQTESSLDNDIKNLEEKLRQAEKLGKTREILSIRGELSVLTAQKLLGQK